MRYVVQLSWCLAANNILLMRKRNHTFLLFYDSSLFCFAPTLEIGAEDRSVECYYHYSVIIIIIIVIVVVVGNDTYDWVNLSSDHPLQVYYKVRHLILLQSRMV